MDSRSRTTYPQTLRSTIRRHPERGSASKEDVLAILREGKVAHVAWSNGDEPAVVPMAYGLWGEELVLHGSRDSRLLKLMSEGLEIAVAVTLLDGLVLARSSFHSSMNYRSVVLFGRCRRILEIQEKARALDAFVDHLISGRSEQARPMTKAEIEGTAVLAFQIEEASAKIRQGPPKEPEEDVQYPVWAGVIPMSLEVGKPIDAPNLQGRFEPPDLR